MVMDSEQGTFGKRMLAFIRKRVMIDRLLHSLNNG